MNQSQEDYAGLLKALREAPDEELDGVSVDRAIRDGRRTVRRRRVVGGLAVVALIVGVSTSPLLLDAVREDKVEPIGPAQTTVRPFDVWGQAFEVGSAGGFTPVAYTTGRRWQLVNLRPDDTGIGANATAVATMYAPGAQPDLGTGSRLDDIDGRPVYLLSEQPESVTIAWQYSDSAWGTVAVRGPQAAQPDRARHVAESIQLRATAARVLVPFTVGKATVEAQRVVGVSLPHGKPSSPSEITVTLGTTDPLTPDAETPLTTVSVIRPAPEVRATTTIGGRAAAVTTDSATILDIGNGYAARAVVPFTSSQTPGAIVGSVSLLTGPGTDNPIR